MAVRLRLQTRAYAATNFAARPVARRVIKRDTAKQLIGAGWNALKTMQGRLLVGMDVEDGVEPGDLQQVVNFFCEVQ